MKDVISVLKNEEQCNKDLRKKAIFLASQLLDLCGFKNSLPLAEEILSSGKAYQKFREIINTQNGKSKDSNDFDERVNNLNLGKIKKEIYSYKTGKIVNIENKEINFIARALGCPETKSAGLYLHRSSGNVKMGEKVITLYSESEIKMKDALEIIKDKNPIRIR
jgi:thymidine phosphorylase